jgi:integrase/recombinase XerD
MSFVFLNRRGQPPTRFGIHAVVERYAIVVGAKLPSVARKRASPHTIRHTTATYLLRAGADISTIRAWLGHVSLATTNVYAEVDPGDESQGPGNLRGEGGKSQRPWREDKGSMAFLRTL